MQNFSTAVANFSFLRRSAKMESNQKCRLKPWLRTGVCLSSLQWFCEYKNHAVTSHSVGSSAAVQPPTPPAVLKVRYSGQKLNWCDILNVIQTWLKHTNTFFWRARHPGEDPIEQLLKLEANKVNTVKKVGKRTGGGVLSLFKCQCCWEREHLL